MRAHDPSRTAELVCLCRAVDQHRPASERIVDDPYAQAFLRPLPRAAGRVYATTQRFGQGVLQALGPNIVTYIQVRHRYIDDALLEALANGAEQVVIAGAGYDCRAYRFAEALEGRPVYELDFPSTGRRKARMLSKMQHQLPKTRVERVEIDFLSESPAQALARTDFEPSRRTVFVWEGVSMYLTREAVKATLRDLVRCAGPGSELAADFWYLVDSPDLVSTAHRVTPSLFHFVGEPIVFGMHPEDLPDFLARQGLRALEVATGDVLSARYGTSSPQIMPGVYVARARLPAG